MRVAVVDIGSNSTRLLIADVDERRIVERVRRSEVTRLGHGVDASGRLDPAAVERVLATLDGYCDAINADDVDAGVAVLTSAVRDSSDGETFAARVRDEYGLDARVLDGDDEARLTFAGATSERGDRDEGRPLLVTDIGGGSTELVVGVPGGEVSFHVSTQAGVVRQSERHLRTDPPDDDEVHALAVDVQHTLEGVVPPAVRDSVTTGVAVAGTATSCAAIELELDPYDPARVHGHVLQLGVLELQLARLAGMDTAERRRVVGLHPDRAPTIVAGVAILLEVMRAFGLEAIEVSEHDILRGVALARAAEG